MTAKNKKIKVQLTGSHPHSGEIGYFIVDKDGKVTVDEFNMVQIHLQNCVHGTKGCYAERKDFVLCGNKSKKTK